MNFYHKKNCKYKNLKVSYFKFPSFNDKNLKLY